MDGITNHRYRVYLDRVENMNIILITFVSFITLIGILACVIVIIKHSAEGVRVAAGISMTYFVTLLYLAFPLMESHRECTLANGSGSCIVGSVLKDE